MKNNQNHDAEGKASKEMTLNIAVEIETLLGATREKIFSLEYRLGKQDRHLAELADCLERGIALVSLVTSSKQTGLP